MDSLSARDEEYRRIMTLASMELLERIRAEREGRTAHTTQLVMKLS